MRHLKSGRKLGRRADHRKAMIKNLAESLINHGRIETTVTRAKEVQRYVEKLVTKSKANTLHARRTVASRLHTAEAAKRVYEELAPQYADRPGGYTRILKTRNRVGDASPMAIIEFVTESIAPKKKKKPKAAPKAEAPAVVEDAPSAEPETVETAAEASDETVKDEQAADAQSDSEDVSDAADTEPVAASEEEASGEDESKD